MSKRADDIAAVVLIVEDHELNLKLFSDLLEVRGHRVLQARDGAEGMKLAREHHPDLILMYIRLPGMSGFEMTKWIREEQGPRYTPIVAITASAMRGDAAEIRAAGFDGYISKPISIRNFVEAVDRFLT